MPTRRGGKRHIMLMMFVGGVVSVIDGIIFVPARTLIAVFLLRAELILS